MDEAQRFLRYVTPGLVFFVETLVLLLILLPNWTVDKLNTFKEKEGLGVIFATLLISGGIGFVFSVVHHVFDWKLPWKLWKLQIASVDHSGLIARLRATKVIELVDASNDCSITDNVVVDREDAWVIMTSLWYERLTTSEHIKGSALRVRMLADMIHTTGAVRIASVIALCFAIAITAHVTSFSWQACPVVRFIIAIIIGVVLFLVHHANYIHVGKLEQGVVEEVLYDALVAEKEKPVKTWVNLERPNGGRELNE